MESSIAEVELQFDGEIPASLKAKLGKYRLAQKSNLVTAICDYEQESPTCSILRLTSTIDKLKDYSVLLVAQDNTTHCTILLNQGGAFVPVKTKTFKSVINLEVGVIYTSISFKPPKSPGSALRAYFSLKPGTSERKSFAAKSAIEP